MLPLLGAEQTTSLLVVMILCLISDDSTDYFFI